VIPGETISTGAPTKCSDCGITVELKVCHSAAGYYVGSECNCGPYSRESSYSKTYEQAERLLKSGLYCVDRM
jgi:hypothetical protein